MKALVKWTRSWLPASQGGDASDRERGLILASLITFGLLLYASASHNVWLSVIGFFLFLASVWQLAKTFFIERPWSRKGPLLGAILLIWWLHPPMFILLLLLAISLWIAFRPTQSSSISVPIKSNFSSTVFGSAAFATAYDINRGREGRSVILSPQQPNAILLGKHEAWVEQQILAPGQEWRRWLGLPDRWQYSQNRQLVPLGLSEPGHVLLVGGTRAGKGVNFLLPTLLRYGYGEGGGSVFTFDPKGEMLIRSLYTREQTYGQPVALLDPFGVVHKQVISLLEQMRRLDPAQTPDLDAAIHFFETVAVRVSQYGPDQLLKRFNPLAYCSVLIKRGQSYRVVDYLGALADLLVVVDPAVADKSWTTKSKRFIRDLLLYLVFADRINRHRDDYPLALPTLMRIIRELTEHEGRISSFLAECQAHHLLNQLGVGNSINPIMVGERERPTIIGDAANIHLDFLNNTAVADSLSGDEFQAETLFQQAQSVFTVIPAKMLEDNSVYRNLGRLWIGASLLLAQSEENGFSQERPILFMLDEVPLLGRMDIIKSNLQLAAGQGIRLLLVAQNRAQLSEYYGNGSESFYANTAVQVFMGVSDGDVDTQQYITKLCGKTTRKLLERSINQSTGETRTRGSSRSWSYTGDQGGSSGGSHQDRSVTDTYGESLSERYVEVDLLPSSEVAHTTRQTPLIFSLVRQPIRVVKTPYYEHFPNRYPFRLSPDVLATLLL